MSNQINFGKKTILIVEDDAVISNSIKEFLEENDYLVLTAFNGADALVLLSSSPAPSMILLDLMMPKMDGFQFREIQLADQRIKDIPVVIMSADGHVAEKKVKTSALEYLKKPVDIFQLLATVQKFSTPATLG
jgi:CheY-like chemotaxis protein